MTGSAGPKRRRGGLQRYRLSGAGVFEALFRSGRRRDGVYLQMVYAPASSSPGRVGFVLGKKALPRAVDRNRLRRMLRPVMAAARPELESYDVIVRLKKPCPRCAFPVAVAEARQLVAALTSRPAAAL